MATTKTIKIQKNKVLTITAQKSGFKPVSKSIVCTGNMTTTINMTNTSSENGPYTFGDRLLGISTFVGYFTPSGTYDTGESLKVVSAKQTTGTSLEDLAVAKYSFISQVETTLGIGINKGETNTFIFTYNGTSWDITGTTTQSGVSDLTTYGITFTGTPVSGNVITVTETYYNRFAFFVLDANYRTNEKWQDPRTQIMPKQYASDGVNCIESATYYNDYVVNHITLSTVPAFQYCQNLDRFLLADGKILQPILPNGYELNQIFNKRTEIDAYDPIIQGGSTSYNLTNWNFSNDKVWCCLEKNANNAYYETSSGTLGSSGYKTYSQGIVPIFELPVL